MHLDKDKERATINALIEREALMRRMATLQEHKKRLEDSFTNLDKDLFGDIPVMQDTIKEYEGALQKLDGPIISQDHPYEPIIKDKIAPNNVEPTRKVVDKAKKKVLGI